MDDLFSLQLPPPMTSLIMYIQHYYTITITRDIVPTFNLLQVDHYIVDNFLTMIYLLPKYVMTEECIHHTQI